MAIDIQLRQGLRWIQEIHVGLKITNSICVSRYTDGLANDNESVYVVKRY